MRVQVAKEEVFTLTIGDVQFKDMRIESRWEGLTKLANSRGDALVVSGLGDGQSFGTAFDTLFGDIFRTGKMTDEAGVLIVMGTPCLITQILPLRGKV
jgi:hypothetical protein